MKHIVLIAKKHEVTEKNSRYIYNNEIKYIKDKISISELFNDHFSLTNTNNSFAEIYNMYNEEAEVKDLIEWIEDQNNLHNNGDKRKFITNETEIAIERILPKLKSWNPEDEISII